MTWEEISKNLFEKRTENTQFTIVDKQFISYYGGVGHKISNGECGFWLWHNKEESQKVCDKLNFILDKNEQLKQRINSRLHFYRELYESTNDKVVERVIEDLEDILKR